ncbi:acetylornithine deacetylase [Geosmithia morbida]|uniref:Acetylornithine deacetylase n=1 Tax=Geosmithia morbida TaxID=1094350 RepID=A0A9P4Z183_9HYPO|nr:acetylornithine deacetylase [Geosmithia morbida]KAF4125413.1 acetylornithine deacetylase [Geosmithia morbida]
MTAMEINEEECLDFLSRLIQHKSFSQTDGEIATTEFMAKSLAAIGLDTGIHKFDEGRRQNVIGTWKPTAGQRSLTAKSILFNGHLDHNPVSEGWTVDPWAGKVDKDFIYGIGVSNMKSGCAAYYCAVKTLKQHGWSPRADVVLTYVVGELQGGVGTMALIEQGHITEDTADCFINCEPSDIRAITMHSEALHFSIVLIGETRHMSAREEATDAILAACELIPILDGMKFNGARSPEHEKCNRCSVGVVHGALGRRLEEWRPAQVADVCKLDGSARYAPGQTQEGVMADIRAVLDAVACKFPGMRYELMQRTEPTMPAFEANADSDLVQSLNRAYLDIRNTTQPTGVLPPTCFYGSDGGHLYKSLGMEGIICGPGGKYNTRPDEKVDIADYLDCIRLFMRVIVDLCGK